MKVNVKGLAFVGFAAAVFAQSAMAVIPASSENENTQATYKKTVTSKYYTNETFQGRETTGLAASGDSVTEKAAYIPWKYGQGGEPAEWVKISGKTQAGDQAYVEIVHDTSGVNKTHNVQLNESAIAQDGATILAASSNAAGDTKKLTTAGAVYGLLDREGSNSGTTITSSSNDDTVPTSKNVYDLVTSKINSANINGNPTYHTQKVAALNPTWAAANATGLDAPYYATEEQIENNPTWAQHIDTWKIIVPDTTVVKTSGDLITAGTSNTASEQNRFTTAKAVYDYAHPRVTTASVDHKVSIGYKAANGVSEWKLLQEDERTNAVKYVELAKNASDNYDINIYSTQLVATGSAILDNNNGDKLVKASAVKELLGGNTLPAMDAACETAGVHCALVSKVVGEEGNTHVELEWTVMAQAD